MAFRIMDDPEMGNLVKRYQMLVSDLKKKALLGAVKSAEDLAQNYGKLQLDPAVFKGNMDFASGLPRNTRYQGAGTLYDSSSDSERTALALEALQKVNAPAAPGFRGFTVGGAPRTPFSQRVLVDTAAQKQDDQQTALARQIAEEKRTEDAQRQARVLEAARYYQGGVLADKPTIAPEEWQQDAPQSGYGYPEPGAVYEEWKRQQRFKVR